MSTVQTSPVTTEILPIVARPGRYYRNVRYLLTAALLVIGMLCIRDGFSRWPRENAAALPGGRPPHTQMDIAINRGLGIALPLAGLALIAWCRYNSRGCYRLTGQTLCVPGHPPVSFEQIRLLDKRLWDRKGIAYVQYEIPGQVRVRRLRLDDFVYDAQPTRQIQDRIEQYLLSQQAG